MRWTLGLATQVWRCTFFHEIQDCVNLSRMADVKEIQIGSKPSGNANMHVPDIWRQSVPVAERRISSSLVWMKDLLLTLLVVRFTFKTMKFVLLCCLIRAIVYF